MNVLTIPFFYTTDPERREATRKVFRHYKTIADNLNLAVVGVGSEGLHSASLFYRFFGDYHEYPQTWDTIDAGGCAGLRAKFDACIAATKKYDPAHVFILGSDDVLTEGFFRKAIESPADLVGVAGGPDGGTRVVRLSTGDIVEVRGPFPWMPDIQFVGGCLRLSRALLERWEWAPFAEPGDEAGIERRARHEGVTIEGLAGSRDGFACWNVKTERVLNGWKSIGETSSTPAPHLTAEFHSLWGAL